MTIINLTQQIDFLLHKKKLKSTHYNDQYLSTRNTQPHYY